MDDNRNRKAVDSAWNSPVKKAATGTPGDHCYELDGVPDGSSSTWTAPRTTVVPTQALGQIDRSATPRRLDRWTGTYGGKDGNRSAGASGPLRIGAGGGSESLPGGAPTRYADPSDLWGQNPALPATVPRPPHPTCFWLRTMTVSVLLAICLSWLHML
ncbi:hypothetical protein E2562_002516 [Oryza meyeriana var. granulata]|uniref:Uncharacterized protein n=1 Tax=Oryza meyeriana var. granulata TaxID=110450 RepID=A0A6G1F2U2_9ORYZ|nr:hypothetical protein E2562_002516 [Oryza meyeriana var. granulata]